MRYNTIKLVLFGIFYFVSFNFAFAQDAPPQPPEAPDVELPIPPPPPAHMEAPTPPSEKLPPPPPPPVPPEIDREIFKVVEQMPRFPGCEDMKGSFHEKDACAKEKMLQYIVNNLKYPSSARKNGTEGLVVVKFVVNKDGRLSDIKIVRDIGDGCGDAAKAVFLSMNEMSETWIPGTQRQKAVNVMLTVPVKFSL